MRYRIDYPYPIERITFSNLPINSVFMFFDDKVKYFKFHKNKYMSIGNCSRIGEITDVIFEWRFPVIPFSGLNEKEPITSGIIEMMSLKERDLFISPNHLERINHIFEVVEVHKDVQDPHVVTVLYMRANIKENNIFSKAPYTTPFFQGNFVIPIQGIITEYVLPNKIQTAF